MVFHVPIRTVSVPCRWVWSKVCHRFFLKQQKKEKRTRVSHASMHPNHTDNQGNIYNQWYTCCARSVQVYLHWFSTNVSLHQVQYCLSDPWRFRTRNRSMPTVLQILPWLKLTWQKNKANLNRRPWWYNQYRSMWHHPLDIWYRPQAKRLL